MTVVRWIILNILYSLASCDVLDTIPWSKEADDIMKDAMGFNPFDKHQPNSTFYTNDMLKELFSGLRSRRYIVDRETLPSPSNQHNYKKRPYLTHAMKYDNFSIYNGSEVQATFEYLKDLYKLDMALRHSHPGVEYIKTNHDEFKDFSNFFMNLEPARRFGDEETEKGQTEAFIRDVENVFFDTRSFMEKSLRVRDMGRPWWLDMVLGLVKVDPKTLHWANDIFRHHNDSWMATTRRAKQLMLTAMHSWIYRTRFNFQFVQRMRWRYLENFRYKLGFCFALIRIISREMRLIYDLYKRFQHSYYAKKWHHPRPYILRVYDKMHRLYIDALDLIGYIKLMEAFRKLEEAPNFYDFFSSTRQPWQPTALEWGCMWGYRWCLSNFNNPIGKK